MIALDDITVEYVKDGRSIRALDGASLEVGRGELAVVSGPSGSGKTTLLMVAGGLLTPCAGTVRIGKRVVSGADGGERARIRAEYVGFVFQTFYLLDYLSVEENVMLGGIACAAATRERAVELAIRFGLGERLGHRPPELSAGECQRVALARAVYNDPAVVLADEPTGNLDPENARTVFGALKDLARGGTSVLVVSHDPLAAGFADRTFRLENGKLV